MKTNYSYTYTLERVVCEDEDANRWRVVDETGRCWALVDGLVRARMVAAALECAAQLPTLADGLPATPSQPVYVHTDTLGLKSVSSVASGIVEGEIDYDSQSVLVSDEWPVWLALLIVHWADGRKMRMLVRTEIVHRTPEAADAAGTLAEVKP